MPKAIILRLTPYSPREDGCVCESGLVPSYGWGSHFFGHCLDAVEVLTWFSLSVALSSVGPAAIKRRWHK